MAKFRVEYYACETQTEDIDADSEEQAQQLMLDCLANDHRVLGRPTDWIYGVRSIEKID